MNLNFEKKGRKVEKVDFGKKFRLFSKKNELYEIEVAIFLDVIDDADLLFKNFSDHFNRKYSVGKKEADGYMTWSTTSNISNSIVAISMINDSQSYGFITIFVRDLSY